MIQQARWAGTHHVRARSFSTSRSATDGALRFDRRRETREAVTGSVVATVRGDNGYAALSRMELVDSSDSGLGLCSPTPIEPGMIVTICVGKRPIAAFTAMATRCAREENGHYRVGVTVAGLRAA
ncbi:MAG: hypothetical protein H7Y88_04815 [Phycisphaerales bacterium]|nr:hypothetical protein [Phycisphaerales bacterium]